MDLYRELGLKRAYIREECVNRIDCFDVEKLIEQVYGIYTTSPLHPYGYFRFSIVAMEEWGNDESHTYIVQREPLDTWDKGLLERFMDNPYGSAYCLSIILTDLCNNGYIEPGEYLIDVSW